MKVLVVSLLLVAVALAQQFPSDAANTNYYTTNYGAPIADDDNSLTVGVRGPTLLEDYTLIEKLANFDRYANYILLFLLV